ncbi:MAG: hypothetical protein ACRDJL_06370 [Actinomycetota bacterium]
MKKKSFVVIASAQDPQGIDFYEVTSRIAPFNGGFKPPASEQTDSGKLDVTLPPGSTGCYRATATDTLGAVSAPSAEKCTRVPVNNTSLKHRKKWAKRNAPGYFLNSFSTTKQKGASLLLDVKAKRLALVATRCKRCGSVKVLLGRQLLKKIKLVANRTRKNQIINIKTFTKVKNGRVKIVVTSQGKAVTIEAPPVVASHNQGTPT